MGTWTVAETLTAMRDNLLDPTAERYTDAVLLGAVNTAGREINPLILRVRPNLLRRTVDINFVANTATYSIPTRVGKILALQRMTSTGYSDYDMLPLEADELTGYSRAARADWYILGENSITIDRTPTTAQTSAIRIHYAPSYVAVHTGIVGGGTTTTLTMATNPLLGTILSGDDVYIGARVRLTNNLPAGVLGLEGTVTDSVASTKVLTTTPAWSTTPTTATTYEIEIDVPDLGMPALVWSACYHVAATRAPESAAYFAAEKTKAINALNASMNDYLPKDSGGRRPIPGIVK